MDHVAARQSLKLLRLLDSPLSVVQLVRPCLYLAPSLCNMFCNFADNRPYSMPTRYLAIFIVTWWQRCLRTIA